MSDILFTREDGEQQKNIYHSHLARQTGLMVKIKGDCRASKYPKGSATHYVYMVLPDENEYCLAVEPECIRAIDDAPKDTWLRVTAGGGKDEPPFIAFEDGDGPVLPDTEYKEPEDAPAPPVRKQKPQGGGNSAVSNAVAMTVQAVKGLEREGIRVDSDAAARIYNTHYIQASR